MRKFLIGLLLTMMLVHPVQTVTYAAAEDYEYSEMNNKAAGFTEPRWSFDYYPKVKYAKKFLGISYGTATVYAWDIQSDCF